jgi:ADP-ribosylglycohydrolase
MTISRRTRALNSLYGLALGDALGSQFFVPANHDFLTDRHLPPDPWQWTDDAEMACSVFAVLDRHGHVDQGDLATSFAGHHDFDRGYGPGMNRLLRLVRQGGAWRELAADLFDGQGSWGNGAAMRVAPLGAWFADDPAEAARQAALSAEVTHAHPEGVAGAVAVAVAAALAAGPNSPAPRDFLDQVLGYLPPGRVHHGVWAARGLAHVPSAAIAVHELGNGRDTTAHDTVPFAPWAAARNLADYEQACWTTASTGGDVDTTCASSAESSPHMSASKACQHGGSPPASHCRPGLTRPCRPRRNDGAPIRRLILHLIRPMWIIADRLLIYLFTTKKQILRVDREPFRLTGKVCRVTMVARGCRSAGRRSAAARRFRRARSALI